MLKEFIEAEERLMALDGLSEQIKRVRAFDFTREIRAAEARYEMAATVQAIADKGAAEEGCFPDDEPAVAVVKTGKRVLQRMTYAVRARGRVVGILAFWDYEWRLFDLVHDEREEFELLKDAKKRAMEKFAG